MNNFIAEATLTSIPDKQAASTLGWAASCHVAEAIKRAGGRLPILNFHGSGKAAGSDLSQLAASLASPTATNPSDRVVDLSASTPTYLENRLTDLAPAVMFGLENLNSALSNEATNRLKACWDGLSVTRQNNDSTQVIHLKSPMIIRTLLPVDVTSKSLGLRCWQVEAIQDVPESYDWCSELRGMLKLNAEEINSEAVEDVFRDFYVMSLNSGKPATCAEASAVIKTGLWFLSNTLRVFGFGALQRIDALIAAVDGD